MVNQLPVTGLDLEPGDIITTPGFSNIIPSDTAGSYDASTGLGSPNHNGVQSIFTPTTINLDPKITEFFGTNNIKDIAYRLSEILSKDIDESFVVTLDPKDLADLLPDLYQVEKKKLAKRDYRIYKLIKMLKT